MTESNYLEKFMNGFKKIFTGENLNEIEQLIEDKNLKNLNLTIEQIDTEIEKITKNESGLDRIKELFAYNESLNKRADFFTENYELVTSVGILGFFIGAVNQTAHKMDEFRRNTQLSIYTDKKTASRQLMDYTYLQTVKGGFKYGTKYAFFTGIIIGTSMVIQSYRNKSSVFDFSIGGALSGGIFRMHYGLYSFVAGATVGTLFGTIFGIVRYSSLKLLNNLEDQRYGTYENRRKLEMRKRIIEREIIQQSIKKEKDASEKN